MNKKQIGVATSQFFGASLIQQVLGFLQAIFLARILGPYSFGIWSVLIIILTYSLHGHLGVIHGISQEIPRLRGGGENELCEKTKDIGLVSIAVLALVWGLLAGLAGFFLRHSQPTELTEGLKVLAVVLAANQLYIYLISILRSDKQFLKQSCAMMIYATVSFLSVMLFAGVLQMGIAGGLLGLLLGFCLATAYAWIKGGYRFRFFFDGDMLCQLLRIGVPILIVGVLFSFLVSLDRWVVTKVFDLETMGYYGLGYLLCGGLWMLPSSLSYVLYPVMLGKLGQGKKPSALRSYVHGPILTLGYFMIWVVGVVFLCVPLLIYYVLPAYTPGILTIQIVLLGGYFLGLAPLAANFLTAIWRRKTILLAQGVTIMVLLGSMGLVIQQGWGVRGIAVASVLAYALYAYTLIKHTLGEVLVAGSGEMMHTFLWLLIPLAVGLGCLTFFTLWASPSGVSFLDDCKKTGLGVTVLTVVMLFGVQPLNRVTGFLDLFRKRKEGVAHVATS